MTTLPLSVFERIYIINLPFRTDRLAEITGQLKKIGLSFESPNIFLFTAVRPDNADDFPSIGAKGCFMSHLGVLRQAAQLKLSNVLILEDDLDFIPNFLERSAEIMQGIQKQPWSIFYGGYELMNPLNSDNHGLIRIDADVPISTTHFIAIQGEAIPALVHYFEAILERSGGDPNGGPMHVDGAYSWFRNKHPDMVTLIAKPELGHQRSSRTDIHVLRWYDCWCFFRVISQKLRQLKRFVK